MEFARLYDPSLDALLPELQEFLGKMAATMGRARPDLRTPEGLAQARDLGRAMGGVFYTPPLDTATTRTIAGPGGPIELRVIHPGGTPKALYLDIHGGGFFMGSASMNDQANLAIAQAANAVTVSVEYRLAPEHPYPAGVDDCEAAALWMLDHAAEEWGVDRFAIGGGSSGANVAAATLLRLRDRHARTPFHAANMVFGVYDLTGTPSQLSRGDLRVRELYLADTPRAEWTSPDLSPLYGDLHDLPPALFTVGTLDYLYDDSLFMAARWHAAGNETELAVYPGAPHGFTTFPVEMTRAARRRMTQFLAQHLA